MFWVTIICDSIICNYNFIAEVGLSVEKLLYGAMCNVQWVSWIIWVSFIYIYWVISIYLSALFIWVIYFILCVFAWVICVSYLKSWVYLQKNFYKKIFYTNFEINLSDLFYFVFICVSYLQTWVYLRKNFAKKFALILRLIPLILDYVLYLSAIFYKL